jgi:hypothetical protein
VLLLLVADGNIIRQQAILNIEGLKAFISFGGLAFYYFKGIIGGYLFERTEDRLVSLHLLYPFVKITVEWPDLRVVFSTVEVILIEKRLFVAAGQPDVAFCPPRGIQCPR